MPPDRGDGPPTGLNALIIRCKCSNIRVELLIYTGDGLKEGGGEVDAWISGESEEIKHPAYMTYALEDNDARPSRREGQAAGPAWRKCWICETRLYRVKVALVKDAAVKDAWVIVNPDTGIVWGQAVSGVDQETLQPFSNLAITLPTSSSSFGRPPHSTTPTLYPPTSQINTNLIPPVHDPFFLPPPFIPSNPHLRELCDSAITYLQGSHGRLEDDVRRYIALKANEMRDLEENVRCEVELLWNKYREGPGKDEMENGSRSASSTRAEERRGQGGVQAFSPPKTNPIARNSVVSPPYLGGSSLLSASLSANAFHAPPPSTHQSNVEKSITDLSKTLGSKSDAREIAMSHIFSTLDEAMGSNRNVTGSTQNQQAQELQGKDSWIDGEKGLGSTLAPAVLDGEEDGTTPRPSVKNELPDTTGGKGKGKEKEKSKVSFAEPEAVDGDEAVKEPEESVAADELDQDDYVFDFELDESQTPQPVQSPTPVPPLEPISNNRQRNLVDESLSSTFAANAPSHRAAWRRIEQKSSLYASLRRESGLSGHSSVQSDEGSISKLATSMPMEIIMQRGKRAQPPTEMERKTSLSEKDGVLVPPLMAAMRERGVGGNSLGLDVPPPRRGRKETAPIRKTSRSASVSRERDQAMSYTADPGAALETLGDEEEDSDEEEEVGGTLRDSKTFIPPHLIGRKESRDGEVGWRSMVAS